ncbi:MAG: hypothetical protein QMD01_01270 [Thermodesulfovibrionales bacterium]|nr:hypothetical protein [Thermodesulfovibrionales bacterium]
MDDKRRLNERKFSNFEKLPDGGRKYWLEGMTMILTKRELADMLMRYTNREIDLQSLISWAEDMMRDADFENGSFELIRSILAHIGLADVREFGLSWDDCYDYLHRLGYDVKIELVEA